MLGLQWHIDLEMKFTALDLKDQACIGLALAADVVIRRHQFFEDKSVAGMPCRGQGLLFRKVTKTKPCLLFPTSRSIE